MLEKKTASEYVDKYNEHIRPLTSNEIAKNRWQLRLLKYGCISILIQNTKITLDCQ